MRAIDPPTVADTPAQTLPESPHAWPTLEVLARLGVSDVEGLSDNDVETRRKRFGPNTITVQRAVSAVHLLLHQFTNPVVYLLGTAAILAFYFGELEEGGAIVAVLAINALIGFVTELKAARSIEALRALGGRIRPVCAARAVCVSSRPRSWCPATSCCWTPATRCRPTYG